MIFETSALTDGMRPPIASPVRHRSMKRTSIEYAKSHLLIEVQKSPKKYVTLREYLNNKDKYEVHALVYEDYSDVGKGLKTEYITSPDHTFFKKFFKASEFIEPDMRIIDTIQTKNIERYFELDPPCK